MVIWLRKVMLRTFIEYNFINTLPVLPGEVSRDYYIGTVTDIQLISGKTNITNQFPTTTQCPGHQSKH
jgi:hypothetical protein